MSDSELIQGEQIENVTSFFHGSNEIDSLQHKKKPALGELGFFKRRALKNELATTTVQNIQEQMEVFNREITARVSSITSTQTALVKAELEPLIIRNKPPPRQLSLFSRRQVVKLRIILGTKSIILYTFIK